MIVARIAAFLRVTPSVLRAQLSTLEDVDLGRRPAKGEWSVKETIGHLIETDKTAFADRIRLMLDEDEPLLSGMDVHELVVRRQDNSRSILGLLDELAMSRVEHTAMVANLNEADLKRTGNYPKLGVLQIGDFVYEWPYHDCAHIAQIQSSVQALFLDGMGPTMRRAISS